jgi:hypothetical protein
VPVRIGRVGPKRVRINEGRVGAVDGDAHRAGWGVNAGPIR